MSRIIISDSHGCFKTLMALIAKLPKNIPITFAADLIDRGPSSRQVVEFVKNGGYDCTTANHEQMMINDLKFSLNADGTEYPDHNGFTSNWLQNGGVETLESYLMPNGDHDVKALKEHVEWMKTLPYYIHYKDELNDKGQSLLVSHSTVGRVWKISHDSDEFKDYAIWARDPTPPKIEGIYNVHGHSPVYYGPTIKEHFANIDGGCAYKKPGYGKLFALLWPSMEVFEQENCED